MNKQLIKYLFLFFFLINPLYGNEQKIVLPKVTAEYVTNTSFKVGVLDIRTRTFHSKNKKRIDTVVDNVPQSVIIDYSKNVATYVWPKTSAYLTVKLNPEIQNKLTSLIMKTKSPLSVVKRETSGVCSLSVSAVTLSVRCIPSSLPVIY